VVKMAKLTFTLIQDEVNQADIEDSR